SAARRRLIYVLGALIPVIEIFVAAVWALQGHQPVLRSAGQMLGAGWRGGNRDDPPALGTLAEPALIGLATDHLLPRPRLNVADGRGHRFAHRLTKPLG